MQRGLILLLSVGVLGGCREAPAPNLPTFTDPPAGARAPSSALLGLSVGQSTPKDAQDMAADHGFACQDLSPTTLGIRMRARRAEKNPDAVSRASPNGKGPNPQVRLSCPDVPSSMLADRKRPDATGRVLYVFDSPKHPLRHVSYRRRHTDHDTVKRDLRETVAAVSATYGPATATATVPEGPLKKYYPYKWEWRFPDVRVEVSALNYGQRGVDVLEAIEVPWPVRADAAAR